MTTQFRVLAGTAVTHAEDESAVIFTSGPVAVCMNIAEARQVAVALARAADEVELSISRQPTRPS